jgi:hypothetical protein
MMSIFEMIGVQLARLTGDGPGARKSTSRRRFLDDVARIGFTIASVGVAAAVTPSKAFGSTGCCHGLGPCPDDWLTECQNQPSNCPGSGPGGNCWSTVCDGQFGHCCDMVCISYNLACAAWIPGGGPE